MSNEHKCDKEDLLREMNQKLDVLIEWKWKIIGGATTLFKLSSSVLFVIGTCAAVWKALK